MTGDIIRKYYGFGGQTIAVRTWNVELETWDLSYFLTDHLGSIVAVTDAIGTLTSQQRYLPFGEVGTDVGTIGQTDYGYTGQRNNSYIKLLDYDFRWYSPQLGRFISPDSIIPDFGNPQSLNRFGYVLNNPIRYSDPTGHDVCDEDGDCYNQNGKYRSRNRKDWSMTRVIHEDGEEASNNDGANNNNVAQCGQNGVVDCPALPPGWKQPNYWNCGSTGFLTSECRGHMARIVPDVRHINGTVTTADLHKLTSRIQNQNWRWDFYGGVAAGADQTGLAGILLSFLPGDPFGTEAFAEKVDDGLIEFAIQYDELVTVDYHSMAFGGEVEEGNLSISAEGYGTASIYLVKSDAFAANVWHHGIWNQKP